MNLSGADGQAQDRCDHRIHNTRHRRIPHKRLDTTENNAALVLVAAPTTKRSHDDLAVLAILHSHIRLRQKAMYIRLWWSNSQCSNIVATGIPLEVRRTHNPRWRVESAVVATFLVVDRSHGVLREMALRW